MDKKRRVLLTHYDLDGISCDILMSKIYDFTEKKAYSYNKIRESISNGYLKWYDSAIVTDISLTKNQFKDIAKEYGKKFLYVDHHRPTIQMLISMEKDDNFPICLVNDRMSATALIFYHFFGSLKQYKGIGKYVSAVNAYDMWLYESKPKDFSIGYDLNILFWEYHYDDFYKRFFNSFDLNFTSQEQKWIYNYKKEREKALDRTELHTFGRNSALFLYTDRKYINDYTLEYPEFDVYYMVYINNDDEIVLSIRSTLNPDIVELGEIVRNIKDKHDIILTAGGHPQAAGVNFSKKTSLDDIIDIIEEINNDVEKADDIPF